MKTLQQMIDENKAIIEKAQKDRCESKIAYRERVLSDKLNNKKWMYKAGFRKTKK